MGALAAVRSSSAGFGLRFLGEADGRLAERKVPLADAWTTRFEYVMITEIEATSQSQPN